MKLVVIPAALNELTEAVSFYSLSGGIELGRAFVAEFERSARFFVPVRVWAPCGATGDEDTGFADFHIG